MRALSPDGRCKAFDASADGMGRGEGCGAVVLKRLTDAVAARDHVLAVIRGSAVRQDGRTSGLTVPNRFAQEALIREALDVSKLSAGDIDYIEAHGTGTPLGDPIEMEALSATYGAGRDPATPLLVGSVKTNIGHLESAAGVAGLIKTILALQNDVIPPHMHFKNPSPAHRLGTDRMPHSHGGDAVAALDEAPEGRRQCVRAERHHRPRGAGRIARRLPTFQRARRDPSTSSRSRRKVRALS